MSIRFSKALVGGFTGTLMMTLIMRFTAPMMIGYPMDIAAMLDNMIGNNYAMGMAVHIMLGVVVFPLFYALLVYPFLPGAPSSKS